MRIFQLAILLVLPFAAQSAQVTWYLQDVQFEDGGTVEGHFSYNSDSNSYEEYFYTTDGSILTGGSYEWGDLSNGNTIIEDLSDADNLLVTRWDDFYFLEGEAISLTFSSSLTNGGGTVAVGGSEFLCNGTTVDICTTFSPSRSIISGYATTVPIPAAVWLFGSALAGLGWIRRKQAI